MSSLLELIHDASSNRRDDACIIRTGTLPASVSFSALDNLVQNMASDMKALGITSHSVCHISLPNSQYFVVAFLAVISLGATVAPLNPALKKDEILYALHDLDTDLLVVAQSHEKSAPQFAEAASGHRCAVAECFWGDDKTILKPIRKATKEKTEAQTPNGTSDVVALALHTSGTTGNPKAVPLLERNLVASARNVQDAYHLTADDRTMLIMPLFHIHGIVAGLLAPLISGSCVVIPEKGVGPEFWNDFDKHKVTWWTATPTHHRILLNFPPPEGFRNPRFVRSCSSPLAPSLLEELEKFFGAPVLEAYAMTENAHHITSNIEKGPRKTGRVGIPCPGISLKIVDDKEQELGVGTQGEVVIKGPSVMAGYRNNPDANKTAFKSDGFFRTGDLGELDEDGHLKLTGRIKELINKGGEKIMPIEIEHVVLEMESVAEAIAFGIPDELYGEDLGLAVVLTSDSQQGSREVEKWLRERVASFKMPGRMWVVDEIPKSATGKVQRRIVSKTLLEQDLETKKADPEDSSRLESLWCEILGKQNGDINEADDFFELGGDSVMAIRLANAAQSKGVHLDAATVFRNSTLGGMASALAATKPKSQVQPTSTNLENTAGLKSACAHACGVEIEDVEEIQPITPLQKVFRTTNRSTGAWVAPVTFKCEDIVLEALESCIEEVRGQNPILRSRTTYFKDTLYNVVVKDHAIWETSTDLSAYQVSVSEWRVLDGCPQVRYGYVTDTQFGTHFVLTTNHTVLDIWSRNLLYDDIQSALKDLSIFQTRLVAPSFCKFAEYVDRVDRTEAEEYYAAQLKGFNRFQHLAPAPEGTAPRIKEIQEDVSTNGLAQGAAARNVQTHLAWALTLSVISGEGRIFFPTVSSGRLAGVSGIESIMGPTIAFVPVCIDIHQHQTVGEALKSLRGIMYQGVQYEPFASEAIARHMGTPIRPSLFNISTASDVDGRVIEVNHGRLVMKRDMSKPAYTKNSLPLHMRVSEVEGGKSLHLRATFQLTSYTVETVDACMKCFVKALELLCEAKDDSSLVELIAALRGA